MTKREMQCFVIGVAIADADYALRMSKKLNYDDGEMAVLTTEIMDEFEVKRWKDLKREQ